MAMTPEEKAAKAAAKAARSTPGASSAGAKVTVFCKLPHGVRIRGYRMRKSTELVMGGGSRDVSVAEPTGQEALIFGVSKPFGGSAKTLVNENGYAITSGVDKDLWDNWLEANKDSKMVTNHLIYAAASAEDGHDWSDDHADARSGLEPFMPEGDPRRPRPKSELTDVKPADEQPRFQ